MITQATTETDHRGFFASLKRGLAAIAETLISSSHLYRRAALAERYFAMSDEELARRGLRRDEIMSHVFGPRMYL